MDNNNNNNNNNNKRIPELVVPAGNFLRLKVAVKYGADAVYLGGMGLDLRSYAPGFSADELAEGIKIARHAGVRVYLALNIIAHNRHLREAEAKLRKIEQLGADALIISDPGLWSMVRETMPQIPVHLSTQAGVANWRSVKFWSEAGVKRINLARELTLPEIREIRDKTTTELEVFVHGAMCLAYSGRCLLSAYLTGRGANRGECTQPCRWSYTLVEEKRPEDSLVVSGDHEKCTQPCRWSYTLVEEKRPEDSLVVSGDHESSFMLSSRDLWMIQHIPELVQSGVNGLKIEGRMKGIHYIATVTQVYREALDRYAANPEEYKLDPIWEKELHKVSHRPYHTGFFFGWPQQVDPAEKHSYRGNCLLAGVVLDYEKDTGMAVVEQRNRIMKGEMLEVFGPDKKPFSIPVGQMFNENGAEITVAPHPRQIIRIPVAQELSELDIMRKYIT